MGLKMLKHLGLTVLVVDEMEVEVRDRLGEETKVMRGLGCL